MARMKRTHRPDVWCWSAFNADRDLDFNSYLWARRYGNVVIDPLPMNEHDLDHLERLGGVSTIVITNSDHVRGAMDLLRRYDIDLCGPMGERAGFPLNCTRWLSDGDEVVPGLTALVMNGSKTAGELALLLEDTTLITGDLVRAPHGGALAMLPEAKLADAHAALASVRRLEELDKVQAVLVGDGWPLFTGAHEAISTLLA